MKKLITLLLILALLLPAAALADKTEQELIGTWVGSRELMDGTIALFIVRLYDDYTALYESRTISWYDTEGIDLVNKGTWEHKTDGVHVVYPNYWDHNKTEDLLLELTQAHLLALRLDSSFIVFSKMYDPVSIERIHPIASWD